MHPFVLVCPVVFQVASHFIPFSLGKIPREWETYLDNLLDLGNTENFLPLDFRELVTGQV